MEEANSSFNLEDIVWSSVQLSVMGLLKNNAYEHFYEEASNICFIFKYNK